MKRVVLSAVLAGAFIFGATTFIACQKESTELKETKKGDVRSRLFTTTTTNLLSLESQKLGLESIEVIEENDQMIKFKLNAHAITFNEESAYSINGRELAFTYENGEIIMRYEDGKEFAYNEQTQHYTLRFGGHEITSTDPNYDALVGQLFDTDIEKEYGWGMFIFNEIYNQDLMRGVVQKLRGHYEGVAVYRSRNYGTIRSQAWIDGFLRENGNCRQVAAMDVSCLWDNHVCLFTVEFDCV